MNNFPLRISAFLTLTVSVLGQSTAQQAAVSLPLEDLKRANVLFIAIDDLRCDLGVMGCAHAQTPQLDALAKTSRLFSRHYIQVPTCGASRCALWSGQFPAGRAQVSNGAIQSTHATWGERSLPALFRSAGYQTLAVGKLTHHPGGLTGKNWASGPEELPGAWDRSWIPDGPWKTPEAIMHGYANGAARQPGKSPAWQVYDGPDEAYPDAWVAADAIAALQQLAKQKQPWFLGVGFFKPHLPFAAPKRWHELHAQAPFDLNAAAAAKPSWPSGWHASGEFRGNYGHAAGRDPAHDVAYARLMRQAYAACVSYVDQQVGRVLATLRECKLEDDTIVVLWSDHGFLLGEHAIWGKHCLYEQALRSPLMIRMPGLPNPGATCSAVVNTVDIFPTLAELCRLPIPTAVHGHSLHPQLMNATLTTSRPAFSYWTDGQRSVRTDRWRLISQLGADDVERRFELFDYESDPEETRNLADQHPQVVQELLVHLAGTVKPTSANATAKK